MSNWRAKVEKQIERLNCVLMSSSQEVARQIIRKSISHQMRLLDVAVLADELHQYKGYDNFFQPTIDNLQDALDKLNEVS